MIDHTGIGAPKEKYEDVVAWYLKALEPLGYKKVIEHPGVVVGLGDPEPDFWIVSKESSESTQHYAFRAKDRATVKKFYEVAIAAGGKDNGGPGLREYHENYFGAYVFDPLGNNVEVVSHTPE